MNIISVLKMNVRKILLLETEFLTVAIKISSGHLGNFQGIHNMNKPTQFICQDVPNILKGRTKLVQRYANDQLDMTPNNVM